MPERAPDRLARAVLLLMALALIGHVAELPGWVLAWCGACLAAGLLQAGRLLPPLPRWVRIGLVLAGCAGVLATAGELWRIEFGATVLAVLIGVKALELSTHRDKLSALFLSLFLAVGGALRSPGLGTALALLLPALAALAALATAGGAVRPEARAPGRLRLAGGLLLAALPLAGALFLFFPRFSTGVVPLPAPGSLTGIPDRLSPGDLAAVARSAAPAFRAEFDGPAPRPAQRYWRCLTLSIFDGTQWRQRTRSLLPPPLVRARTPLAYTVVLEPHWNTWLPALDLPLRDPELGQLDLDRCVATQLPVRAKLRYSLVSALDYATAQPPRTPGWALDLPGEDNPRARELGRRLAVEHPAPADRVRAVLDLFASGGFAYTLSPPPLGRHQMDDFLFATRSGYCGHYAAAAAFLLRAAEVPARVVGGYVGGEENPVGGYFLVRQSNAHAWVEALLPDSGWTRVDPTLAVAPGLVSLGPEAVFSAEDLAALRPQPRFGLSPELLQDMGMAWDALAFRADPWLGDYDLAAQESLLRGLGIAPRTWAGRAAALAAGLVLAVLAGLSLRPALARLGRGRRPDPAAALYARFCARLARAGLPRPPHQGPLDYARRVSRLRPDLGLETTAIAGLYAGLRYGRAPSPRDLHELRRRVRAFRPGRQETP